MERGSSPLPELGTAGASACRTSAKRAT
jgi:hypothetical protein